MACSCCCPRAVPSSCSLTGSSACPTLSCYRLSECWAQGTALLQACPQGDPRSLLWCPVPVLDCHFSPPCPPHNFLSFVFKSTTDPKMGGSGSVHGAEIYNHAFLSSFGELRETRPQFDIFAQQRPLEKGAPEMESE